MKSFINVILLTLLVIALVWVFISTSGNTKEYNDHMCQDVYGLNADCK